MAIMIDPRRGSRESVKKSEASQRVLDALDKYIEGNFSEPMKWIVGLWRDQATVLTYGELMSIVTDEDLPKKIFDDWFGDYSRFIAQKITPMWQEAMIAAVKDNPLFSDVGEGFDTADYYVRDWMTTRSANLVTACLDEQKQAIRYIVSEGKANKWSTSETARYIRPMIGLTEQQAAANQKYYNTVKEQTRENHPRMTDEAVERKAREAAGRYAARQQRTRAETIARTEMATAYNEGNDQYVRQAMRRGQMPRMVKVWSTADDGHVCSACEDLEGVEVGMDDEFKVTVGKRVHREVATLLPPLHPRCKCAILYEEAEDNSDIASYEGLEDQWRNLEPNEQLNDVNPEDYNDNCVNCSYAFEMRCRGKSVVAGEAMDVLRENPFAGWVINKDDIIATKTDDPQEEIRAAMKSWGEGARAQITVLYASNDGHSFSGVQEKYAATFLDVQVGGEYSIDGMNDTFKDATLIQYCRVDKLELNDIGFAACKEV